MSSTKRRSKKISAHQMNEDFYRWWMKTTDLPTAEDLLIVAYWLFPLTWQSLIGNFRQADWMLNIHFPHFFYPENIQYTDWVKKSIFCWVQSWPPNSNTWANFHKPKHVYSQRMTLIFGSSKPVLIMPRLICRFDQDQFTDLPPIVRASLLD